MVAVPFNMKAAIATKYGDPGLLEINDVPKPTPKDGEVLVRVRTTTVNRTDTGLLNAEYFVSRFFTGLFRPKNPIFGTDFAGEVETVGEKVTNFKPGEKVFGFFDQGLASHAEYTCVDADGPLAVMPEGITYDEAVACVEGAHYAYNFINKIKLEAGQWVLVNGATGAIGSALMQLLRYYGIRITAVCKTQHFELVKSLGAEKTIDYTREDFTKDTQKYAFVFDAVGKRTFGQCKPLLEAKGAYISSKLGLGGQNIFLALVTPLLNGRKVIFPLPVNCKRSILFTKKRIEERKFKAVIDRRYSLEDIAKAYEYVNAGQKIGAVIINV